MNLQEVAPELSKVFMFVAATAAAIRTHSAYNPQANLSSIESAVDVQWLSDAMCKLDQFGSAMANNNAAHLAAACEAHIGLFNKYFTTTRHPYSPGASFNRAAHHFNRYGLDLPGFIEVLELLRSKALAQAQQQRTLPRRCTVIAPRA